MNRLCATLERLKERARSPVLLGALIHAALSFVGNRPSREERAAGGRLIELCSMREGGKALPYLGGNNVRADQRMSRGAMRGERGPD